MGEPHGVHKNSLRLHRNKHRMDRKAKQMHEVQGTQETSEDKWKWLCNVMHMSSLDDMQVWNNVVISHE
jgi:hypothetical protein